MNSTVTDSLSREKIRQLLAAVGSMPSDVATEIEAAEYDWHQPHYFSREQLGILESFTKNLAAAVAEKFAQLYHSNFDVTTVSTTQHFAGELLGQISSSKTSDYYLAFGPDQKHLCGFISIPEQTAIAWVTQLLGEAESDPPMADRKAETQEDSAETLSQLEESLLVDIAAAIVAALSACYSHSPAPSTGSEQALSGAEGFEPAKIIVRGELPVELQQLEELCKIVFAVRKAGSENRGQAYLVIPCSELVPVTGRTTAAEHKLSAEDISKAIIGHLHRMPVSITAQLARTFLTFQELVAVRPCDILLLDKAIDESVELIVDGRTLFRGRPARSAAQYAIVITESLG
jgi:flagellar motor switch protein FliM